MDLPHELEVEYLQKKLERKNNDIFNIRKRLDQVLDELDMLKVENNVLLYKCEQLEKKSPPKV